MINTVPAASVVGMGFSLLVAFALPITLFILCRKRLNAARLPALIGALTFTVAVLVLENAAHGLLRPLTSSPAVQGSVLLTAVYGGLMAALFEEFGRLAAMKLFMKKTLTKENALMYGVGHGGIEAVLTAGILYISNLATAIMVNTGSIGAALGTLDEAARAATVESLSALCTTDSYLFFMAGVERISAIALHICLSYLVYRALRYGEKRYFFAAMGLHFAVDAATVLLAASVPILALELILLAAMAVVVWLVSRLYRAEASPAPEADSTAV
mgnify:FL=1